MPGLALVTIPIAIHLLVRQQSRRVAFPSLRFLLPSQLAAFRRRNIQDALLLACRAAIIAAAALALAGPVIQTASRTAGYGARIARAVIVEPGTEGAAPTEAVGDAFASKSFARHRLSLPPVASSSSSAPSGGAVSPPEVCKAFLPLWAFDS